MFENSSPKEIALWGNCIYKRLFFAVIEFSFWFKNNGKKFLKKVFDFTMLLIDYPIKN